MWVREYSKTYQGIKKEDIWQIWTDVNNWPKWDRELEYCKTEAPFIKGSRFALKPLGGPKVEIILSHVTPNKKFTVYCKFFGATMYDDHELEDTAHGLLIRNTITVTGLLSFIWWQIVAKKVANSIPKQMETLVEFAKSKNA